MHKAPGVASIPDAASVIVATFNVNNINRRLPNLLAWLKRRQPDIVCLQELKAPDMAFPQSALEDAGYQAVWSGQKTWNGVAILARGEMPTLTQATLPGDPDDQQSRYIEAVAKGLGIGCIYLPNGNPQPGPKFAYKLAWFERLIRHARILSKARLPILLAGDFNVVPTDRDIYSTKSWRKDALLQPEARAAFQRLLGQGWLDSLKASTPENTPFTFWDYFRNHWERDAGLRIDHILLNRTLAPRLLEAGVDRWVRGEASPSDHAPVWVRLAADSQRPARTRAKG